MTAAKKKPAAKPLPCPFCGCKPKVVRLEYLTRGCWVVTCNAVRCMQASTDEYATRAEAIAAWNRRAK